MAKKTLIRSNQMHEVKLEEGSHLAQGRQAADLSPAVPTLIRKRKAEPAESTASVSLVPSSPVPRSTGVRRKAAAPAEPAAQTRPRTATRTPSQDTPPSGARASGARGRSGSSRAAPAATAGPRLPARVPADQLWEADSTVMQRLQSLQQRNALLSEQLQRLQTPPLPKGSKP